MSSSTELLGILKIRKLTETVSFAAFLQLSLRFLATICYIDRKFIQFTLIIFTVHLIFGCFVAMYV